MPVPVDKFGKAIVASRVLTAEALQAFWAQIPREARPKDGAGLAQELVAKKQLTRFQAQALLAEEEPLLVLGDYVLLDKIGAGGMGQVFKAQHRHMERLAAIKLLPAALTKDEAAVKRFQREVKAAARLSHPHIVQTYDASVQDGVWYLVMEYVEGRDLSAIINERGALPISEAVQCLVQAARGLAYAHGEGVIHRDIKPANLLLDKHGTVKILDMGLARFENSLEPADHQLTSSGEVMGTVDYMAPEQALNTKTADARADVYSLGCTFYRLLTGKNVYDGETLVQKLLAHQNTPIPAIAKQRPDLPLELAACFERMVAKRPEDRFQSMTDVVAALAPFVSDPSGGASRTGSGGGASTAALSFASGPTKAAPLEPTLAPGTLQMEAGPQPASEGTLAPTVALVNPLQGTEPVSDRSIQIVRDHPSRPSKPRPATRLSKQHSRLFIAAAGVGGLLLLLLGIWVVIRDKNGKEVARVPVPDGGSVSVQEEAKPKQVATEKQPAAPQTASIQTKLLWNTPVFCAFTDLIRFQNRWWCAFREGTEAGSFDGQLRLLTSDDGENWLSAVEFKVAGRDLRDPRLRIAPDKQLELFAASRSLMGKEQSLLWRSADGRAWGEPAHVGEAGWRLWDLVRRGPQAFGTAYLATPPFGFRLYQGTDPQSLLPTTEKVLLDDATEAALQFLPDGRLLAVARREGGRTAMLGISAAPFDNWTWRDLGTEVAGPRIAQLADGRLVLAARYSYPRRVALYWLDVAPARLTEWVTLTVNDYCGYPGLVEQDGRLWVSYFSRDEGRGRVHLAKIPIPPAAPPAAIAPFDAKQARAHQAAWAKHLGMQVETPNGAGQKMVLIPPGEFLMGSTQEQIAAAVKVAQSSIASETQINDIRAHEGPQHSVAITRPFLMSATEITVGQFKKFSATGYQTEAERAATADPPQAGDSATTKTYLQPGYGAADEFPACFITWNDATAYCQWLSKEEKATYRLPTEAEWEFACRAGTVSQYSFGDDVALLERYGWHHGNSKGEAKPVGTKLPNGFGLFDMHGNAYEWCRDFYGGYSPAAQSDPQGANAHPNRVLRGGTWFTASVFCRSGYRMNFPPIARFGDIGFRVVREVQSPSAAAADAVPPRSSGSSPESEQPELPPYQVEFLRKLPGSSAEFVLDGKLRIERRLYDPETGKQIRDLVPSAETRELVAGPAISQDGSRLAWITADGELSLWDGVANKLLWQEKYTPPGTAPSSVALSSDGRLAAGHVSSQGFVWSTADHQLIQQFPAHFAVYAKVSPSGRYAILPTRNGWLMWDNDRRKLLTQSLGVSGWNVAFAPDETVAVLARQTDPNRAENGYYVTDLPTGEQRYKLPQNGLGGVAIAPDGKHLFHSGFGEIRIARLAPAAPSQRLATFGMGLGIDAMDIALNGRFLAAWNFHNGEIYLFRVRPASTATREAAE